jgi:phosphoribosylanthranilate isomerase
MIKGLKICGVSDPETLNYILNHNHKPIMIGFITNYEKSKRFVEYEKLKDLINLDKKQVNFVSVLVNPNDEILEKIKDFHFDYYQLYDVSPERTQKIKSKFKKKIITALTISSKNDVIKYKDYSEISDIILFDSKGYDKSESFDHSLLDDVPSELNKMIAGNIQIDDIPNFKNKDFIIDLSGALEDQNGKKDIDKIDNLLNTVHNINS